MIYDLIFVEADDCYYAMPRGNAEALKTIYERTQLGTSGLHCGIYIPKEVVETILRKEYKKA